MTKELLILGLYFNFFFFLRCYIVKQNWIGLLWHKIHLQSNSPSLLDDYLKGLSPLPRPTHLVPCLLPFWRPIPSEGHMGKVGTRPGAHVLEVGVVAEGQ